MAIQLEANYSKKIGLPGYSSHQYSVTVRTELTDISQIDTENTRLYTLLQTSVDREIQQVGYLPEKAEGRPPGNGRMHGRPNGNGSHDVWKCSDKQKSLILRMVEEHEIDKNEIEALAQDRFGKSVKGLNKLEASGLIEELFEKYPSQRQSNGRFQPARTR